MLTQELLTTFTLFAMVSSITPGPNNTMVLASGINFGIYRTIPHILGISIGFSLMVIAIGFGLGEIFKTHPMFYNIIRYLSIIYLLYLAGKIALSEPVLDKSVRHVKPMNYFSAMAFQWINPKAWMTTISAVSTYAAPDHYFTNILIISIIFFLIIMPSVSLWAIFGSSLRQFLTNPKKLRIFNIIMALLLVGSLYPLLRNF